MLINHRIGRSPANAPGNAVWVDLIEPDEAEIRAVEEACSITLPSREALAGIELSSRIGVRDGVLRLGVPYFSHGDDAPPSPLGFLLSSQRLITLRYASSPAFDLAAARVAAAPAMSASEVLIAILESAVATNADRLEHVSAEMGRLSSHVFARSHRRSNALRAALAEVGRLEGRLTRMRQSATGLQRIVLFLRDYRDDRVGHGLRPRIETIGKDLEVLAEFDSQLTDKLQFLLDAVLGFINIDQNEVIKILTVASVVSIPPMVLAGIWGMNFEHMPELHWPWGYGLALGVIALSAVAPLAWLKRRGWM